MIPFKAMKTFKPFKTFHPAVQSGTAMQFVNSMLNMFHSVSVLQTLESLRPELRGRVLGAAPYSLGERIWRLPRLLQPLDAAIRAVRACHDVPCSYALACMPCLMFQSTHAPGNSPGRA
jgi:hypothetical protein